MTPSCSSPAGGKPCRNRRLQDMAVAQHGRCKTWQLRVGTHLTALRASVATSLCCMKCVSCWACWACRWYVALTPTNSRCLWSVKPEGALRLRESWWLTWRVQYYADPGHAYWTGADQKCVKFAACVSIAHTGGSVLCMTTARLQGVQVLQGSRGPSHAIVAVLGQVMLVA